MQSILDTIHSGEDVKKLDSLQLDSLSTEIRECIIDAVSKNGGHLASNLGVVELTIALMRVFSPPNDSIVWDVGHQAYTYKLLTGRYKAFASIRKECGLSGFPSREESECDSFSTGHSSASISSALGISEANHLKGKNDYVVVVIGDGALTGGLAYEGLNNAGRLQRNFIVILNDNNRSISKNVGSLAKYLKQIRTKPGYIRSKRKVERRLNNLMPDGGALVSGIRTFKRVMRKILYPSNLFENLGFSYYGPFDGHNIGEMTDVLESAKLINKPILLHICTNKGKGYQYAEEAPGVYHGPSSFDRNLGVTDGGKENFSSVFGSELCKLAEKNEKICAITAAMRAGTGLTEFRNLYSERFYDVGIAEEHAVTFAGGLARGGMIPVFAVYSTFLQRAYDELLHDAALQGLKVILAIDRAGIVGEDGKTHQGVFDTSFLMSIPKIAIYSPAYYSEILPQLKWLVEEAEDICAIRYPRGVQLYKPSYFRSSSNPFDIYGDLDSSCAVVTYGRIFSFAAKAVEMLEEKGVKLKLVKLNRITPIDKGLLTSLKNTDKIYFYEEGLRSGGVGEHFLSGLFESGYKGGFMLRAIENPFIKHAPMYSALESLGFSEKKIYKEILQDLTGKV